MPQGVALGTGEGLRQLGRGLDGLGAFHFSTKEKVEDENSGVPEIDSLKVKVGWLLKVKCKHGEARHPKAG